MNFLLFQDIYFFYLRADCDVIQSGIIRLLFIKVSNKKKYSRPFQHYIFQVITNLTPFYCHHFYDCCAALDI